LQGGYVPGSQLPEDTDLHANKVLRTMSPLT